MSVRGVFLCYTKRVKPICSLRWFGAVAIALLIAAPAVRGDDANNADAARINKLVRRLGSVQAETRAAAARDLLEIGPAAVPALTEAQHHRDPEIAAAARALLDRIDQVLLFGSRIVLRAEPAAVAWDQPFDLVVNIENGNDTPCAIPFSPGLAALADLTPDARQVGRLVEIADFLEVRDPDGNLVEPHIFDIDDAVRVSAAIRRRADGMVEGQQAAHSTKDYRVSEFNRGRMRYRLLRAGRYRIQFVYAPEWDDPALIAARVGYINSNVAEVQVTSDAPAVVRESDSPMALAVERSGGELVAYLVSAYDLPASFNLNIGEDGPHFASAAWLVCAGEGAFKAPMSPTGAFRLDWLKRLAPGQRVELGRIPVSQLMHAAGMKHGESVTVSARYDSVVSRSAAPILGRAVSPADRALLDALPPYLISGACESPPMRVVAP